ncbi:T9SS type A sorting domain-containing protein [Hymenobacter sp. 5317J-9]|uniref:T9SS type A sorting domain-containing protein n=1 Tax=Hymenobacter sp. 5317J-9 TaxID=2932250 RepID=UPI001FD69696|nr:T9SS type A sorting domain-containing protein [Hymenobacter sp. 5317J-9]UOQ98549.1 T9SS type A sorting domain-containing protein [Hymenobacter sp. 5317J-9]
MRHRFLLVLLFISSGLLLGTAPARAQFRWQRAVGTAQNDETADYMLAVPGGFVKVGEFNYNRLYLSKVNYQGDTVWTKRYALRRVQDVDARGLIADAAGNLIVSAIVVPRPVPPTAPPLPTQGLLVKLTPAGDTLWTRRVADPAGATLTALVPGNDGSYVAVGDVGSGLNTFPVLRKFSPAGALLWTQVVPYDNTRNGYLTNLVAVPNGYLVVSLSDTSNLRPKFITVDEAGAYQFFRFVPRDCGSAQLKLTSQGGVIAVGGGITQLTVQGDSVWSRAYRQVNAFLGLTRVAELPGGRYLAAGERSNGFTKDVGFVVVDANGALLRDTLLVRPGTENVAGVGLTPAGDYVVALGTDPGPVGYNDQILFAYRSWARLLPARAPAETAARLAAYPNPTIGELTLEAGDARPLTGTWVLYDVLGRLVQHGLLSGQARHHLSLTAVPAGLYLLRVTDPLRRTVQLLRLEKL